MGAVACERHGTHPGVLCCEHIRAASEGQAPLISVVPYRVDMTGDGTEVLDHLLCRVCANRFRLSTSSPVPPEVWESKDRYPHVCPTCEQCLSEWQGAGRET